MDFTKLNDVAMFVGKFNELVYGVSSFTDRIKIKDEEELEAGEETLETVDAVEGAGDRIGKAIEDDEKDIDEDTDEHGNPIQTGYHKDGSPVKNI